MRSRVFAIVLAAVLALVGVVLILAYVRQANERAVAGLNAETVLVAAGPIPAGTSLTLANEKHLLHAEDLPVKSLAHAGPVVSKVTSQNGPLVVSSAMTEGQVLTQDMLAPAGSTSTAGGLAVPSKMSAVSLDICVPEDVASYVTPGATVAVFDVLVPDSASTVTVTPSCESDHPALGRTVITNPGMISSMVVLPSVTVLAVGQASATPAAAAPGSAAAQASAPSSGSEMLVTFAVDQQQAEELMVLQQAGIPYLALLGSQASMNAGAGPGGL